MKKKKNDFFLNIFTQNIHCGYTLEPPLSNEYPQSMLWIKNKKIRYTPANPSIKVGFKAVHISHTSFPDVMKNAAVVLYFRTSLNHVKHFFKR